MFLRSYPCGKEALDVSELVLIMILIFSESCMAAVQMVLIYANIIADPLRCSVKRDHCDVQPEKAA